MGNFIKEYKYLIGLLIITIGLLGYRYIVTDNLNEEQASIQNQINGIITQNDYYKSVLESDIIEGNIASLITRIPDEYLEVDVLAEIQKMELASGVEILTKEVFLPASVENYADAPEELRYVLIEASFLASDLDEVKAFVAEVQNSEQLFIIQNIYFPYNQYGDFTVNFDVLTFYIED